ncbi:AtpZ/AtpI family protein [Mucilaginibacter sp. FT3.2]|uniref:AtpZ/AtpI family protein n=1 Tax=Mucilaginibacter sp. FT3.2 TaxID=2723090 RepID=UPI00161B9FD9|nr:AtpZ/AtpI family protein [Mucilaginibacter sp. FT3.2]MBB6232835.1 F0F1-type ATP synthase assembly protein I [Mucilaginibacter sp. FT3.2]
MAQNEQGDNKDNEGGGLNTYAKFSGIAFQMVVVIGIGAFAGYKIDEATNHQTKWVTALLSLVGVFISLYIVIRSLKN